MTTINSQEDFLRALRENPEWMAAVRAVILGEELLQLPVRFDALVVEQQQFNERVVSDISDLKAGQVRIESDMSDLKAGQEGLRNGQARIESRMDRHERDMSTIKGALARWSAERSEESLPMEMGLEYLRTLSEGDLMRMARSAGRDVTVGEIRSFRRADMVVEARDESGTVYIAMEASFTGDLRDSDRAQRNARLLTEFIGHRAIPVVASVRNVNEVSELVESGDIHWYELEERDYVVE